MLAFVENLRQYHLARSFDHQLYWETLDRSRELLLGNRYREYLEQIAPGSQPPEPLVVMPVVEELASFSASLGQRQRPWYRQELLLTLQRLAPYLISDQSPTVLLKEQHAGRQLQVILKSIWERALPIIEKHTASPGALTSQYPETSGARNSPAALGQALSAACRQQLLNVPEERQALRIEAHFYRRLFRYSGWSALLEKGAVRAANLSYPRFSNNRWLPGITASSYFYSSVPIGDLDEQAFTSDLLDAWSETIVELTRCRISPADANRGKKAPLHHWN